MHYAGRSKNIATAPATDTTRTAGAGVVEAARSTVPLARSAPVRMQIPAIGVDSALMALGLQDDGSLEVPPEAYPAGWYTGAPTPGQLGPSIITGHVRWNGPGVFANLDDVKPGNEITISRRDGTTVVFGVDRVEQFPKNRFPTEAVYGDLDHAGLRLITCADRRSGRYQANVVVFATLVASSGR